MTKAMRMMEENVKIVDGAIMVLDARAPLACQNPEIEKLFKGKPILYVFNKSDLADINELNKAINVFSSEGKRVVPVSALAPNSTVKLLKELAEMFKEKAERNALKGVKRNMKVMVVGIPNTGKSTLINSFAGKKKAVTGDKAGVTKGKQWIETGKLDLLDTPGTMPPSFSNQQNAKYLAFLGSVNDDILDFEELSTELIKTLSEKYPNLLKERYNLSEIGSETEVLDGICKKRGFLLKGGICDYERCYKAVIDDFRKGKIGKITLI